MTPDISIPGWETSHILQEENEDMRLMHKKSMESSLPSAKSSRTPPKIAVTDATILALIPPHPNIIKLYSSHIDIPVLGKTTLVFEFCAGGDVYSLRNRASQIGVGIPESFLWHLLYQALNVLEHLNRLGIVHNDLHIGNLFLRPVDQGDSYPDLVLADFEYSGYTLNKHNERHDLESLGGSIQKTILDFADDETECGSGSYSQELRDFVKALSDNFAMNPPWVDWKGDLIPTAKKMAYANEKATGPQMPAWMLAYFAELKSKAYSTPDIANSEKGKGKSKMISV
ncbi:hypothetical protein MMC07_003873 [Pseudocyphellaria aurata]|nr:hypothetical protein [Pseudocyphellaria aurata]